MVRMFMNRLLETINECVNKQPLIRLIGIFNKIEKKLSEM